MLTFCLVACTEHSGVALPRGFVLCSFRRQASPLAFIKISIKTFLYMRPEAALCSGEDRTVPCYGVNVFLRETLWVVAPLK